MALRGLVLLVALVFASCGGRSRPGLNTRSITLPNGKTIVAEVMIQPADLARGMMFREQLERDRGMLFMHPKVDFFAYWMYQVKVPLDIIWLDAALRIVEISPDTPPCYGTAAECPHYGGLVRSQFVLELPAGDVKRLGLKLGDKLTF